MEIPYTTTFEEQRLRYHLCFTCETCSHFDAPSDACSLGYPNSFHRLAFYESNPRPEAILFCKEYECG